MLEAEGGAKPPETVTRIETLKAHKVDPEMPPLHGGAYLVQYLWEVGPVFHTGAGPAPLPHTEILAWQRTSGLNLQPWETAALRRLSMDYLSESQLASKPDRQAPFPSRACQVIHEAYVDSRIDEFLS